MMDRLNCGVVVVFLIFIILAGIVSSRQNRKTRHKRKQEKKIVANKGTKQKGKETVIKRNGCPLIKPRDVVLVNPPSVQGFNLFLQVVPGGTNFLAGQLSGTNLQQIKDVEILIPGLVSGHAQIADIGVTPGILLQFYLPTTLTDVLGLPQFQLLLRTQKNSCHVPLILTSIIPGSKARCDDISLLGSGFPVDTFLPAGPLGRLIAWPATIGTAVGIEPEPDPASTGFSGLRFTGLQGVARNFESYIRFSVLVDSVVVIQNGLISTPFIAVSPTQWVRDGAVPDDGVERLLEIYVRYSGIAPLDVVDGFFNGCSNESESLRSCNSPKLISHPPLLTCNFSPRICPDSPPRPCNPPLSICDKTRETPQKELKHTPAIGDWSRNPVPGESASIGGDFPTSFQLNNICAVSIVSLSQPSIEIPVTNLIVSPLELLFQIPIGVPLGPAFFLLRHCRARCRQKKKNEMIPIVLAITVTPPDID